MTTDKYDIEEVAYSTQGWNAILNAFITKMDNHLHTRVLGTLGENFAAYEAGYIKKGGTTWWKARANRRDMPAMGVAVEAGNATDEIRFQRVGPITNAAWSWAPGKPVFLSLTAGALSQTPPTNGVRQIIGYASSITTINLCIDPCDVDVQATTTTTSTSTSTTTSTSTSTSTTSTSTSTSSTSTSTTSTSTSTSSTSTSTTSTSTSTTSSSTTTTTA